MPHSSAFSDVVKKILALGFVLCFVFPAMAQNSEQDLPYAFGIYYTTDKGDTLITISERFFDSAAYWPELWKDNPHIKNPYEIPPGERIRLFNGSGTKKIPKQFLMGKARPEKEAPFTIYAPIHAAGFIKAAPLSPLGSIFKVIDDKTIISERDTIFLWRTDSGSFAAGNRYIIFRILNMPEKSVPPGIGLRYQLAGIAEITDIKPGYCVGNIVQSFRQIRINDQMIPYEQRSPKIVLTKCPNGINGRIIASEDDKKIMGDGDIAFVDKGKKDGILPGQQYVLYDQERRVNPNTNQEVSVGPNDFGTILVLIAEENASTVVITQADKKVAIGDRFRTPSLMD